MKLPINAVPVMRVGIEPAITVTSSSSVVAGILPSGCDPDANCTRSKTVKYPCPTWNNPGRKCKKKISADNPACQVKRAACREKLGECVANGLAAYGLGNVCIGCITAGALTGAIPGMLACSVVCGLSASRIGAVIRDCG